MHCLTNWILQAMRFFFHTSPLNLVSWRSYKLWMSKFQTCSLFTMNGVMWLILSSHPNERKGGQYFPVVCSEFWIFFVYVYIFLVDWWHNYRLSLIDWYWLLSLIWLVQKKNCWGYRCFWSWPPWISSQIYRGFLLP